MRVFLIIILFILSSSSRSIAQENYWIFFKERDLTQSSPVSEQTYKNRKKLHLQVFQESDFGPNPKQLETLKSLEINVRQVSRWFNAASARLSAKQIADLKKNPAIKSVQKFSSSGILARKDTSNMVLLTYPLVQINAVSFLERGWLGDNVKIGVIDGGFHNLDTDAYTSHLVENKRVKTIKDFFEPNRKDFYSAKRNNGELHGTQVLAHIGGFNKTTNAISGIGLRAEYYLARTETSGMESRIEEDNWVAALEWLDSLGVRLVNSSLGYSQGFTNPNENYKTADMDGKTSVIALGAQKAIKEKGMIIISAAGNEGENSSWESLVSTPGDVDEVISVGACSPEGLKLNYSSIGPDFTTFTKPDICVYSQNGTSLAAPVITGLVAGILQENPDLSPQEVKEILQQTSSLNFSPNNYIGHGWPNAEKISELLEDSSKPELPAGISAKGSYEFTTVNPVTIFHKKDSRIVIEQKQEKPANGKVKLLKPEAANFSTVINGNEIFEIIWQP